MDGVIKGMLIQRELSDGYLGNIVISFGGNKIAPDNKGHYRLIINKEHVQIASKKCKTTMWRMISFLSMTTGLKKCGF